MDTRAGDHRGHRTNEMFGLSAWLWDQFDVTSGELPPGAFGGSRRPPLTPAQEDYLRSMCRTGFLSIADRFFTDFIADVMGLDPEYIYGLMSGDFCKESNAAIVTKEVAQADYITLPVDNKGMLVSQSNAFWNKCFRDEFTGLEVDDQKIAVTSRRGETKYISCSNYVLSRNNGKGKEIWEYAAPGALNMVFTYDRSKNKYYLPSGYVLKKLEAVAGNQ